MIADADCMEVALLISFLLLAEIFVVISFSVNEAEISVPILLILWISEKLQDGVMLPINS